MSKVSMDHVRRSNRFRVVMNTPLRIGLKQGTLVDISTTGVLATHSGTLKTGSTVEISFNHEGRKFVASAQVASCTVVGLGAGDKGATLYASRLYFTTLTAESRQIVESLVNVA